MDSTGLTGAGAHYLTNEVLGPHLSALSVNLLLCVRGFVFMTLLETNMPYTKHHLQVF